MGHQSFFTGSGFRGWYRNFGLSSSRLILCAAWGGSPTACLQSATAKLKTGRMKRLFSLISGLVVLAGILVPETLGATSTDSQPASVASVERLLDVMHVDRLIASVQGQFLPWMRTVIDASCKNQALTTEDRAQVETMAMRIATSMQADFTWQKFKPVYVKVYAESFSEAEVEGLTAFYSTPIGQSAMTKLPLVMKNTMAEVQPMMIQMMQRAQSQVQEFVVQTEAKHSGKAG